MRRSIYIALGCLLLTANDSFGQTPELITDRPDQTESTAIVPPKYFQVESGYTLTQDEALDETAQTHEFPGTLIRAGIIDGIEGRLGWGGYTWEDNLDTNVRVDGGSDIDVGAKIHLLEEQGIVPQSALMLTVALPTGSAAFTSDRVDPAFRFTMSHTLSERLSLGYNLGTSWVSSLNEDNDDLEQSAVFNYTTSLGISVTEKLGMFVEVFGDVPVNGRGRPQNSFDGGFTYKIKPNLQLDTSAGVGLSEEANDFFVGAGISVLWPNDRS